MADVTVKLTVGNFSVEVSGAADYVDKKIEDLVSRFLSTRKTFASETGASTATQPDLTGKQTSAAEFLKKSSAKNQADRALVLGYYLEHVRNFSSFTSTELALLGKETKQPFTNPSDTIAKLSGRGLMMSAGDKESQRAHALTASGEAYVDALMEAKPQ